MRVTGGYIQNTTIAIIHVKNTGSTDITIDFMRINTRLANPEDTLDIVVKLGETKKFEVNASDVETVKNCIRALDRTFQFTRLTVLTFLL